MAIQVIKGPAHSLKQTDFVGKAKANEGVVAGMLVRKNANGEIVKGVSGQATAVDDLLGFAVTNQDEGDAIESGKIGVYALDGASIIATDQVTGTLNTTTFPIGSRVAPDPSNAGKVRAWQSGDRVIGTVVDIRNVYIGQTPVGMLAIKLHA